MLNKPENLIEIKKLNVNLGRGRRQYRIIKDLSLDIGIGEVVGLTGESGSGKTTLAKALLGILPIESGEILFESKSITGKLRRSDKVYLTRNMQMIFQDPEAVLNDKTDVESILSEPLNNFKLCKDETERKKIVGGALKRIGLAVDTAYKNPNELSLGEKQRVCIARAFLLNPKMLIADEPCSALDSTFRAKVLNRIRTFAAEDNMSCLLISHDLDALKFVSDKIAVMYYGRIVELCDSELLFSRAVHPYTKALIDARPQLDPLAERMRRVKAYDPTVHDYKTDKPKWIEIEEDHWVFANETEAAKYKKQLSIIE